MLHYRYDGSFDGLLNCISRAHELGEIPDSVSTDDCSGELFAESVTVVTDSVRAQELSDKIRTAASWDCLRAMICGYLSEIPGIEKHVLAYGLLALRYGRNISRHLTEDPVLKVMQAGRKVGLEVQRLKGMVRFKELSGGLYYAQIEPDHRVLELLSWHFSHRFASQKWMIHDIRRGDALYYNGSKAEIIGIVEQPPEIRPLLAEDELLYERLWKGYFKIIAIAGRKNPRLQKQFMPERYWKYLIEKEDENPSGG
jgi:probable DNA metabolism protein